MNKIHFTSQASIIDQVINIYAPLILFLSSNTTLGFPNIFCDLRILAHHQHEVGHPTLSCYLYYLYTFSIIPFTLIIFWPCTTSFLSIHDKAWLEDGYEQAILLCKPDLWHILATRFAAKFLSSQWLSEYLFPSLFVTIQVMTDGMSWWTFRHDWHCQCKEILIIHNKRHSQVLANKLT